MITKDRETNIFKICWIKNIYNDVYDYYYDLSDDKVYCINLSDYNKTQISAPVAIAFSGPLATIFGSIFAGEILLTSSESLIFLTIATIIIAFPISIAYDKTNKAQTRYIKENASGEHLPVSKVKELLKEGRKYICGLMLFILMCFLCGWFGAHIFIHSHDQIGIVIFAASIFALTIFIKILSPLNLLKLLIILKKEEKEQSLYK